MAGADAIIALRCCKLSGRFEDFWERRSRCRSHRTMISSHKFVVHPISTPGVLTSTGVVVCLGHLLHTPKPHTRGCEASLSSVEQFSHQKLRWHCCPEIIPMNTHKQFQQSQSIS